MADMLITVGVDVDKSYAPFEAGVKALLSRINSEHPEIKVFANTAEAKKEISSLVKMVKSIGKDTKVEFGEDSAAQMSAQIKDLVDNLAKMNSALAGSSSATQEMRNISGAAATASRETKEFGEGIRESSDDAAQSLAHVNAALKEIGVTNSSITSSYKSISKALDGSEATGQDAVELEAIKAKYTELMEAVEKLSENKKKATDEDIENVRKLQVETESLISTTRRRLEAENEVTKLEGKRDKVAKKYRDTLKSLNNAVKNYSAAEKSRNAESRESYSAIKKAADEMARYLPEVEKGTAGVSEMQDMIDKESDVYSRNTSTIQRNGDARRSLSDQMGNLIGKFSSWLTVSQVVMQVANAMKKMVTTAIEVDSAMTQLRIVTGASDAQMSQFFSNSAALAKDLGKSITDVVGSIETFSRLGYNLTDSSELAKYANILSNVANTDAETATTGLTSIIKGYNMDASQAEHVSDVLVKVGQEYAISAEELMAAFQRGGAALYATGTDFEKSAALFAATNASLQNAETVGTMWKTVSARIRGATTELEEMGEETDGLADGLSKYRQEIINLTGVDIMKDENTYKDIYDIFVELAQVWDNLKSDKAQARVAEILGGTRQYSGIMSTITNIKDAIGAYESALDSAGTSMKAQEKITESIAGHIGVLKSTFQELSVDFVSSNFVKGVIDFSTVVLEFLDSLTKKLGALPALITAVFGTRIGIKSIKNVA